LLVLNVKKNTHKNNIKRRKTNNTSQRAAAVQRRKQNEDRHDETKENPERRIFRVIGAVLKYTIHSDRHWPGRTSRVYFRDTTNMHLRWTPTWT